MKVIGFWLLLLVAVLVPATATVAASVMYPDGIVAKKSTSNSHGVAAVEGTKAASMHGGSSQKHKANSGTAQADLDKSCCDTQSCASCVSCTACLSMVAVGDSQSAPPQYSRLSVPALAVPRVEFLLAGQERPPRRA